MGYNKANLSHTGAYSNAKIPVLNSVSEQGFSAFAGGKIKW